ncbi:MAG: preprotein translocase subunit SecG [Rikenellaceae bacterium]|nr:preprotein translocase subunit SecG [Rikenellaceae bacterium]
MLYTICVALIVIASILIILAVLVQNPKSGMAANFGASNQVMGVRETTNFLEKFTWTMAIAILVLSLVATTVMDTPGTEVNSEASKDAKALQERMMENAPAVPQTEIPAQSPAAETPAEPAAETPAK